MKPKKFSLSTSKTPNAKEENKKNNWQVYILLASDQRLYTGITTNIVRRWQQHQQKKGAKFFYGRHPIALTYLEGGHNRSTASQREYQIKQLTTAQKWALIYQNYGPLQNKNAIN
jgi:putative endonuclease